MLIGKIVGVHGLKGTLKVLSYVESMSFFKTGSSIRVINQNGIESIYTLKWVKPHKRGLLFQIEDVNDCDMAQPLIGSMLHIDREALPVIADGTYYWVDLIGLSVVTSDNICIGRVESIFPTGSNDVLVVKDNGNEILVPALESVIREVDLENGTLVVDLPEGL